MKINQFNSIQFNPLDAFRKSRACPGLGGSLFPHFHPHIYKIAFHFTDIHYLLIHFHHLSVSCE